MRRIKPILARALNRNQILILCSLDGYSNITRQLEKISGSSGVPLSTLKLNARILMDIGVIDCRGGAPRLTEMGRAIFSIMRM
ncbi:MAG: hypothetical protein KGH98_01510 [Candidatus Micrarchaeota archaeon]|nr:hypothetical protein [Candidatus Micrarchaeota archaeon]